MMTHQFFMKKNSSGKYIFKPRLMSSTTVYIIGSSVCVSVCNCVAALSWQTQPILIACVYW